VSETRPRRNEPGAKRGSEARETGPKGPTGPPPEAPEPHLHFIEPDGGNREEVRRLGYRFVDLVVDSASSADARSSVPEGGAVPADFELPYSPSFAGRSSEELLRVLRERVLPAVMNPAHPGYVGHMDSLSSTVGIFADAIVSACNNNMLSYEMSLLFTKMERAILDWATGCFGWGEEARGYLVSGGTLANLQAIWTARNVVTASGRDLAEEGTAGLPASVLIASEHAHYSFSKTANILGLGRRGLRRIAVGGARVAAREVEEAIAAVRREGARPFALIGIAGTTVTGAIEPLEELGALARRHGLWFHVDAAYGGSLILSPRFRARLQGCETADSITWNPQKWLFVPKACATLLYRDGSILEETVRERFLYGREQDTSERVNLGEYTIQGTRRVDALKLWLTLEHLGLETLSSLIERSIDRARWMADTIRESPGLELLAEPDLNIVCFRARPLGVDPSDGPRMDALQIAVQREVARLGHGWLSLPIYRGRRILRAVILHPRCDEARLRQILNDVERAARTVLAGSASPTPRPAGR
jgi:glutamate/tyrosine decarboxylase-like PLP-dependent enzyme